MPTYTYACQNEDCAFYDQEFDVKQRMADEPLTICPHCESETLKKIIKNCQTVIFNGGGWSGTGLSTPPHVKIDQKKGRARKQKKIYKI